MINLASITEDRLTALRQVLEEKLVKRKISLKSIEFGNVEDAAGSTVRQVATLSAGINSDKSREINKFLKALGIKGLQSQTQGEQLRVTAQEARRPPGGHGRPEGGGLRHPPPVPELPGLTR